MNKKILLFLNLFFCAILSFSVAYAVYPDFSGSVEQAEKESVEQNKKLLLIFGADWCSYCIKLKKDIEYKGDFLLENYVVCYVEYESNPDLVKKYNVGLIPDSIVREKDKTLKRIRGYNNFESYVKLLK